MFVAYIPWLITVLVTVALLSSCAVGPDFVQSQPVVDSSNWLTDWWTAVVRK